MSASGATVTALLVVLAAPATAAPSDAAAPAVRLAVGGEVAKPAELEAADLAKLPRQSVRVTAPGGKEATFEGVSVAEILRLAGVAQGNALRGKALMFVVVVEAADGYKVTFSLAELDPAFGGRLVLLADRRDGQAMDPAEGPLRLVIPGEPKHARWVRQVVAIRVKGP